MRPGIRELVGGPDTGAADDSGPQATLALVSVVPSRQHFSWRGCLGDVEITERLGEFLQRSASSEVWTSCGPDRTLRRRCHPSEIGSDVHFCSALGGIRTPNLLIRSQ